MTWPKAVGRIARILLAASIALIGAAFSFPARATDFAGDVPDRVWIDIGAAANDITTQVAVSTPTGIGTTLDLEKLFNLPGDDYTGRMFGTVRISPQRRYIDFGYEDINRSGSRVLEQDIQFGGYTFLAGGNVTARFGTGFIYAAFRYDFLHLEPIRVSGSVGLTYIGLTTSLAGQGNYIQGPDGTPISHDQEVGFSAGAPVPMFGLNLDWALARRLVARAYIRAFRINVNSFGGGLYEDGMRLNWYFARHFGLGLGYDQTIMKITKLVLSNDDTGQFGYDITGFSLFINLAF